MTWKSLWNRAIQLQGQTGIAAYDLGKIALELSGRKDFLHDCKKSGKKPGQEVESLIEGLNLTFKELCELLKHYPKRDQWASGKLRTMYNEMVVATRRATPVRAHARGLKKEPEKQAARKLASKDATIRDLKAKLAEKEKVIAAQAKEIVKLKRVLTILGASDKMAVA